MDGWSPQTLTRHEYETVRGEPVLVASVTTTEAEWSELDYAWMEALTIYEASLCPGCNRPIDVCADEYTAGATYIVDSHICTATLSRAVQQRVDEWENTDRDKRPGQMPTEARWHDGRMYAPHLAHSDELFPA